MTGKSVAGLHSEFRLYHLKIVQNSKSIKINVGLFVRGKHKGTGSSAPLE